MFIGVLVLLMNFAKTADPIDVPFTSFVGYTEEVGSRMSVLG